MRLSQTLPFVRRRVRNGVGRLTGPHCQIRLGHAEELLSVDLAVGKQLAHFRKTEQADACQEFIDGAGAGSCKQAPDSEISQQLPLPTLGQVMDERRQQMRFEPESRAGVWSHTSPATRRTSAAKRRWSASVPTSIGLLEGEPGRKLVMM
jgi:hypothetical protein